MSKDSITTPGTESIELKRQFLPLLTQHQRRIFAYIYTLIPNRADAEDLLQETSLTLWEKFETFEPGTDFFAWACRIAYWKVRNARRKHARSPIIQDERLMESLCEKLAKKQNELDRRHEALAVCLNKLSERDRRLIASRYESGTTVKELAERAGRKVDAMYKTLSRIRCALMVCVSTRVKEAGA